MADDRPIDLLLVEDDEGFRETAAEWMARNGLRVTQAGCGAEALEAHSRRHFDVAIVDMNMPGMSGLELMDRLRDAGHETQIIILTGQATIENAVAAMKLGACDYLTKPFALAELERRVRMAADRLRLQKENRQLKELVRRQRPATRIIGSSAAMQEVLRLIDRVAPTHRSVLIQGESGTGKELVARAIQERSLRAERPFVTINCAALPDTLVESELFGHEKGSFTGATAQKPGLFEIADGGTLFIDEIGELPSALQPKLLRVLEDGSFRRVGAHQERRVDVRLIAATNRDLRTEVAEGRFREDLYYRINVITVHLPPLRQREGDVALLLEHLLQPGWEIEPEARTLLDRYRWPGNVRQLINVLDRATILADDRTITIDDLPQELLQAAPSADGPAEAQDRDEDDLASIERAHIVAILEKERGNKARAARALGIHRRKLYRLIQRYGIESAETPAAAAE
ncbi:MAG: sigma-54-dependent Fis family transcriptional regulator [Planctomyces sp.]|nr:sigma-54-dependent Fis family transcriptional regulator [Planctomyces sp.]